MAKNPKNEPVSNAVIPLHKKLAMGMNVETGAGKGAVGKSPKTPA